ncbi:hypothetical protein PCE1_001722 [Barthelona sp. PCE]
MLNDLKDIAREYSEKQSMQDAPGTAHLNKYIFLFAFLAAFTILCRVIIGDFPFNAFLGALFCSVGCLTLTVSLKIQLNKSESSEFKFKPSRILADFFIVSVLLIFISISFLG